MTADPLPGEFTLIDRIVARLGEAAATDVLLGPGDDAAVWLPSEAAVVATTDALAEGTHWRADTMSLEDVGWRAIVTNVSDLAAMGARAQYVLVAAMLGPNVELGDIDGFVEGVAAACKEHGVRVAGGDVVRAASTAFSVSAIGAARLDRAGRALVLRRDAARPGDAVAVSGYVGAAAAGLALIQQRTFERPASTLINAHRRPRARLELGQAALSGGVACGMDVSDGLAQDLGHIARRSGVGIEVDVAALPVHPAAVELFGVDAAREFALAGGEDYELALTGRAEALRVLAARHGPLQVIGRVVDAHPGEVVVLEANGLPYARETAGWDQMQLPLPKA